MAQAGLRLVVHLPGPSWLLGSEACSSTANRVEIADFLNTCLRYLDNFLSKSQILFPKALLGGGSLVPSLDTLGVLLGVKLVLLISLSSMSCSIFYCLLLAGADQQLRDPRFLRVGNSGSWAGWSGWGSHRRCSCAVGAEACAPGLSPWLLAEIQLPGAT